MPAAVYEPSPRQWSEKRLQPMEYSDDWQTRAVRGCGQMQWRGMDVRITRALVGERIGLKPAGNGVWDVYFGTFELGRFDERKGRVDPPKKKPEGKGARWRGGLRSPSFAALRRNSGARLSSVLPSKRCHSSLAQKCYPCIWEKMSPMCLNIQIARSER